MLCNTSHSRARLALAALAFNLLMAASLPTGSRAQLPDDIQRELEQNLAEQARIQATREAQRRRMAASGASAAGPAPLGAPMSAGAPGQPAKHDPNNYSYQHYSPPMQYSYYQPYGDAAQPASNGASAAAANQRAGSPSFSGVGGLPVMQARAGPMTHTQSALPMGNPPLAPQARTQQQRPLTEADFRDITGGDNYGAPAGSDFGLGGAMGPQSRQGGGAQQQQQQQQSSDEPAQAAQNTAMGDAELPGMDMGAMGGAGEPANSGPAAASRNDGLPFGLEQLAGGGGLGGQPGRQSGSQQGGNPNEFDFFASQPSSARADQASAGSGAGGGAPGSLQALLGGGFPGLGGLDGGLGGLGAGGDAGQQGAGQGAGMDMADMGDRADQFGGADMAGFEQQPQQQQEQQPQPGQMTESDFGLAAAAAEPQPSTVPYPDGAPQAVGALWALTQPQSLGQPRYSALPDKGTYQEYPAYQAGAGDWRSVSQVVDSTPRARRPGPGRYAAPAASELAPEVREHLSRTGARGYDYSQAPHSAAASAAATGLEGF